MFQNLVFLQFQQSPGTSKVSTDWKGTAYTEVDQEPGRPKSSLRVPGAAQTPGSPTVTREVKTQFVSMGGGRQLPSDGKVASGQKFRHWPGFAQTCVHNIDQKGGVAAEIILKIQYLAVPWLHVKSKKKSTSLETYTEYFSRFGASWLQIPFVLSTISFFIWFMKP